jgi:anti-sigma B factor antagonist
MTASEHTAPGGVPFDGQPGTITIVHPTDTIVALEVEGEFDTAQAPEIVDRAERLLGENKHLIINLSGATFIDSAVVHALFRTDAAARAQGRSFVLQLGTASNVERVIAITGADKHLTTAPDREEAIRLIEQDGSDG